MNVRSAKRIVAKKLNVGTSKVKIDTGASKKIKEAITGQDLEGLIKEGTFTKRTNESQSMGRARILKEKKKKGRKKGKGTRRGKINARQDLHALWITKIRSQRKYILTLLSEKKIDNIIYRDLYRKAKGGFFRSKSHIDSYLAKK